MQDLEVTTSATGVPVSFTYQGSIWVVVVVVVADPVRWFERVPWWETKARMSTRGAGSRIDVEVRQVQAARSSAEPAELVTFELVLDGSVWSLRSVSAV